MRLPRHGDSSIRVSKLGNPQATCCDQVFRRREAWADVGSSPATRDVFVSRVWLIRGDLLAHTLFPTSRLEVTVFKR